MAVFWTILTKLTFSFIINDIYVNILIFVYGCTYNAPRIPKIYNIIGIWWTDQKLLTVKPIATLRYTTTTTTTTNMKKTTEGEMKDIWRNSYINKKRWGAQDIWPPGWLTDRLTTCWKYCPFLTEWMIEWQAAKDIVTFLNN